MMMMITMRTKSGIDSEIIRCTGGYTKAVYLAIINDNVMWSSRE